MKLKTISNPVAKFSRRFNKAGMHKPKRGRGSYNRVSNNRVQGRQYNIDEDFYELYERDDTEDGS